MQKTLNSAIDIAITKEQEAYDFYMDLFNKVEDKEAKSTLKYIAQEEARHKEFLMTCQEGRYCATVLKLETPVDFKIVEHMEKPDIKKNIKSEEIYLIAANRELNAYNFYSGLAQSHPAGDVKELFTRMANEELKHKEKMEYLYANTAFTQTAGG